MRLFKWQKPWVTSDLDKTRRSLIESIECVYIGGVSDNRGAEIRKTENDEHTTTNLEQQKYYDIPNRFFSESGFGQHPLSTVGSNRTVYWRFDMLFCGDLKTFIFFFNAMRRPQRFHPPDGIMSFALCMEVNDEQIRASKAKAQKDYTETYRSEEECKSLDKLNKIDNMAKKGD